ncbi:MAG TPA: heme-binding protein [Candidatus Methylomirabilis sp.]|nr:heme-binding protein [Candidatus Methylomirabilis sp.]
MQTTVVLSMLIATGIAQAQAPPPPAAPAYGGDVSLDAAKKIAMAAESEAKKNGWTVVIAVVDTHGSLVMLERLDNTQLGSIGIAVDKARTAAAFKRPSKVFEDAVAGGRNAVLGLQGVTPIEGGLPLMLDGKVIGAIGVSGMTSQQDGMVAKAGADSVGK